MNLLTALNIVALTLATVHFVMPLAYYFYPKNRYLDKP